jgi:hypothetical protein
LKGYQAVWNSEPEVSDALAKINFNSVIGVGFPDEDKPRGVFVVENGKAVRAGTYAGEALNWDMRAKPDDWAKWQAKGIGMTGLGMAAATGKLKFRTGDYGSMLKNPAMAGPFVKSFSLMGKV